MYISLKDSCSKGFNKWADTHQPEIKQDVLADGGHEVVAADPGLDNGSATASEKPRHYVR
jgi:hypothetical protein